MIHVCCENCISNSIYLLYIWKNLPIKFGKTLQIAQKYFSDFKMKNILCIFEKCRKYYTNLRNTEKYAKYDKDKKS